MHFKKKRRRRRRKVKHGGLDTRGGGERRGREEEEGGVRAELSEKKYKHKPSMDTEQSTHCICGRGHNDFHN